MVSIWLVLGGVIVLCSAHFCGLAAAMEGFTLLGPSMAIKGQ